jgi:hypothetical protein
MKKYHFGQFQLEHLFQIRQGIEEYNAGHFWQCHEEIEDIWLDSVGDDARYIMWAIIQAATCLYHWEDDNLNGAAGMVNKAKKKILYCEERKVETDITEDFLNWSKFKAVVKSIPSDANLNDFKTLREFKFPAPSTWPSEE